MLSRENKVSRGVAKLIKSKKSGHFMTYTDIFIDNPSNRIQYFEMFNKAQIVEIANSSN